jgi:phosphoribosylamine---glycine ligase
VKKIKALVIGQGGREHALVRALRLSPSVQEVHALPGSDAIALEAQCHPIQWEDFAAVLSLVREIQIDLVVVGPEVPLVAGLSDALRAAGVKVFGPSQAGAQLEGSKIYSKKFMVEAGVPTARYEIVSSVEETRSAARAFAPPYVLKADGLAAGKGVFICKTEKELFDAADELFVKKSLGVSGARALLEEFQPGYEISYLVLTNGEDFEPLLMAQDHKRLRDGDEGPNTGGMGVVAPVDVDSELREWINRDVVRPSLAQMRQRGLLYRGVLYVGLMITPNGPSVIEYNARFGDPEAQVLLPLLDGEGGDWGQVLSDLADGRLRKLSWKKDSCCCVVLAAEGYPDAPVKGAPISGLPVRPGSSSSKRDETDTSYILHAGTVKDPKKGWVTSGGRVLNAIGVGKNLSEAIEEAYAAAKKVSWAGRLMRTDIGAKIK